jgi:hypothetical protein
LSAKAKPNRHQLLNSVFIDLAFKAGSSVREKEMTFNGRLLNSDRKTTGWKCFDPELARDSLTVVYEGQRTDEHVKQEFPVL